MSLRRFMAVTIPSNPEVGDIILLSSTIPIDLSERLANTRSGYTFGLARLTYCVSLELNLLPLPSLFKGIARPSRSGHSTRHTHVSSTLGISST